MAIRLPGKSEHYARAGGFGGNNSLARGRRVSGPWESNLLPRLPPRKFKHMRTLSLEEAVTGLGRWLELAIAGEDIRIRKGDAVVELRPVPASGPPSSNEPLSTREALRRLQAEARLTPDQAQQYLNEVHDERLAAEARRPP